MEIDALVSASTIIARLILGSVLLWAGVAKARQVDAFETVIRDFGLTNRGLSRVAALLIPVLECGIGLLILFGLGSFWAAIGAIGLLGIFTFLVLINLQYGRHLPCLCFGNSRDSITWRALYRNVGLVLLAIVIILAPSVPLSLDEMMLSGSRAASPTVGDFAAATMLSGAIMLVWFGFGDALRLFAFITDRNTKRRLR